MDDRRHLRALLGPEHEDPLHEGDPGVVAAFEVVAHPLRQDRRCERTERPSGTSRPGSTRRGRRSRRGSSRIDRFPSARWPNSTRPWNHPTIRPSASSSFRCPTRGVVDDLRSRQLVPAGYLEALLVTRCTGDPSRVTTARVGSPREGCAGTARRPPRRRVAGRTRDVAGREGCDLDEVRRAAAFSNCCQGDPLQGRIVASAQPGMTSSNTRCIAAANDSCRSVIASSRPRGGPTPRGGIRVQAAVPEVVVLEVLEGSRKVPVVLDG